MLDLSKPVRTKGSKTPVEIVANRPGLKFPIIGIMAGDNDYCTWNADGTFDVGGAITEMTLENIPEGK